MTARAPIESRLTVWVPPGFGVDSVSLTGVDEPAHTVEGPVLEISFLGQEVSQRLSRNGPTSWRG